MRTYLCKGRGQYKYINIDRRQSLRQQLFGTSKTNIQFVTIPPSKQLIGVGNYLPLVTQTVQVQICVFIYVFKGVLLVDRFVCCLSMCELVTIITLSGKQTCTYM